VLLLQSLPNVTWTKVDQSDFHSLSAIDPKLAEEVKHIATVEGKHFRDVLRSAISQRRFRQNASFKKWWATLSPEERSEHSRKASLRRWSPNRGESDDEGT
jgi:hypothetical protein